MAKKTTKREERAHRQRELQRAAEVSKRREQRQSRIIRLGGGLALLLVLILAGFLYYSRGGTSSTPAVAASASLGSLSNARPAGATGNFQRVSAPLGQGGKPAFLFVGAQYCPFCAAERWAVVKALSRFGHWSNLKVGHSSGDNQMLGGGFSDVPTFVLAGATYSSPYVVFQSKDIEDNAGHTLQQLSPEQKTLFDRYDGAGSIPFVYVDGYAMTGSDYSPAELQGRSFASVQQQLEANGAAGYSKDINAETNLLTAFLCRADGNRPGSVCGQQVIRSIERGLA